LGARGIDRAGEEISRAFPGLPLLLSFGDVIKTSVENKPALVLATPGSAPKVKGGYGAVVILEGWKFFAHADLRSQERARELFFETAAMASANAAVLLSIDESHPIVSSLIRWSPGAMIRRELSERLEIPLPPYVSSVTISGEAKDFSVIASGLRKAIEGGRLPREIKIFGPSEESRNIAKIVMYCPPDKRADLADFLLELTRRRSIAKKDYLTIRFDPYSL
jgi:primosomal protein N' (replication factor Y)